MPGSVGRWGWPVWIKLFAAACTLTVVCGIVPARADLYSATQLYQKADYSAAFAQFMALAKLGQPVAQYNVALMYRSGRGTAPSDIYAYAWAMLAAENGEARGRELADQIRPLLAPGSERIAGWITALYTPAALHGRLLPALGEAGQAAQWQAWIRECYPRRVDNGDYPSAALERGIQGGAFAEFALMPDGTTRFPRVVLEFPQGVHFGDATRRSILNSGFTPLPPGAHPVACAIYFQFANGQLPQDYRGLIGFVGRAKRAAEAGDPMAELNYGMMLMGLPQLRGYVPSVYSWFVKAAQAGLPLAQYEVGFELSLQQSPADQAAAIRWFDMAAAQNEPHAEVELALRAIRSSPGSEALAQSVGWLESAAAQENEDAELYLAALVASTPDAKQRDPARALTILQKIFSDVRDDPLSYEIRAAAQAAQGDFTGAVDSERAAIEGAKSLHWDLAPLEERLARYQAGKPWYGNLLAL